MIISPISAVSYLDYTVQNNIDRVNQANTINATGNSTFVPQTTTLETYSNNASTIVQSNTNIGQTLSLSV